MLTLVSLHAYIGILTCMCAFLQELFESWSAVALRYQLGWYNAPPPAPGASQRELVEAYWSTLLAAGKQEDEETRRWLKVPKDFDLEAQAKVKMGVAAEGPAESLHRNPSR